MPCPCRVPAVLLRGLQKSLSEWHVRSTARAQHGHGMACVNETRWHCVNQMGKTQSKTLAARHGRERAWNVCELAFSRSAWDCLRIQYPHSYPR